MLLKLFSRDQLRFEESMRKHTTMRVGGPAEIIVSPRTASQVDTALRLYPDALVIGNGSNLIVRDGGIEGLVISLDRMCAAKVEGALLQVEAGMSMAAASLMAQTHGLSGLEFASGIPGSMGGGCAMNAGAYGEDIAGVLTRAQVLRDGRAEWIPKEALEMGYRSTKVLREGWIVLTAEFALTPHDPVRIKEKMDDLNARRREKQPLDMPSCGSTFKRPEGYFAGALIQDAGLKGLRVGGAMVSEKHAGFIVNAGGASASDVLSLIALVQEKVLAAHGVALECEVRVVGRDVPGDA